MPDLPLNFDWPLCEVSHLPYSFLAQINLSEVSHFDQEKKLPTEGMLLTSDFF